VPSSKEDVFIQINFSWLYLSVFKAGVYEQKIFLFRKKASIDDSVTIGMFAIPSAPPIEISFIEVVVSGTSSSIVAEGVLTPPAHHFFRH